MYTKTDILIPGTNTIDHYYKSIISFSHLLGSMTGIVVDYFKSAYPKDYIKGIWNSKEEPFEQRSESFRNFMIKPRPLLLIEQKFDPAEDSEFRPMSEFDPIVSNSPNLNVRADLRDSIRLIDEKGYQLYFAPRRYKINFSASMVFDSDEMRIRAQNYFRQSVRHKMQMVATKRLECYIPDEFMRGVANIVGIPFGTDELADYLNARSIYPIKHRLRTGSGKMEYFVSVPSPLQIKFADQTSDGPVKKGNIVVKSSFSESIELEFTCPAYYVLRTLSNLDGIDSEIDPDTISITAVDKVLPGMVVPVPDDISDNFDLYRTVKLQGEKNGEDIIDVPSLVDDVNAKSIMEYYRNTLHKEIDFINVSLFKGVDLLEKGKDYEFNNKDMEVKIYNIEIYETYRLCIYLNRAIINNTIDMLYKTEGREK